MTLESATKLQINEGHGENFFFGRGHSCRFSNSREGIRGGQGVNIIFLDMDQKDRHPPVAVVDLFSEFRDGSRLLDLLEVLSGQRMKGRGTFQHRTNIEKCLAFLKRKSIKLVNINVSDIMDGKHSIILGLIWTIIMHFHIEELASTLNFSSRQSSLDSLASLDTRSTSSSARSSPVPPRGSPLHTRFRISAKKALLLWVREQAGCTLNVKDFKESWRSGVVFLAILHALRPNIVDLTRARTRTNRQNLEEAFHIAERELHIPRLLDPADVDVRDPDEKSIMTYVAQFLQYSKDTSVSDEEVQNLHQLDQCPAVQGEGQSSKAPKPDLEKLYHSQFHIKVFYRMSSHKLV
uniref:Calponin-homology (CH) domain-containing protein n=1 Tax=Cyprinus carpio TaxID=7962 RepID=A0A8C1UUA5_CYPCA